MRIPTNHVVMIAILSAIFLLFDLFFFNSNDVFILIIGLILLYFAFKKKKKTLTVAAIVFLFIAFLTFWSLRLIPILILIYFLYLYMTNQQNPLSLAPIKKNVLIGDFETSNEYKWEDIQVQKLIGNITIDATETILPNGKSFIHLQQGFGKTTIYVPYEVTIELHLQTIYGELIFLNEPTQQIFNGKVTRLDGQSELKRTLVIYATSFICDLEVQRR